MLRLIANIFIVESYAIDIFSENILTVADLEKALQEYDSSEYMEILLKMPKNPANLIIRQDITTISISDGSVSGRRSIALWLKGRDSYWGKKKERMTVGDLLEEINTRIFNNDKIKPLLIRIVGIKDLYLNKDDFSVVSYKEYDLQTGG